MALVGKWRVYQNGYSTSYTYDGLNTDTLEYRSGFNTGQSTTGCSAPTSIWQNNQWLINWACNASVSITFSFEPDAVQPITKYDCINGNCVLSTQYNTPGFYASLQECQNSCGNTGNTCPAPFKCLNPEDYCPPGKVCIPSSEWAQIENLSSQLRNKNCS